MTIRMVDYRKTLKQMLGKKGGAKAMRILISEYQKYLVGCLKSDIPAVVFEQWVIDIGKKKKGVNYER